MDDDDEDISDFSDYEPELDSDVLLLPSTPSCNYIRHGELSTIYETESIEPINMDEITENPDVERIYNLELDDSVREEIQCDLGKDMELSYQYIYKDTIIDHIDKHAELSPFFPLYTELMESETDYVWIHVNYGAAEHIYYFCPHPVREYEMVSAFTTLKEEILGKLEELGNNPLELEELEEVEQLKPEQNCVYGVFNTEYDRQQSIVLSSVDADELCGGYVCFESNDSDKEINELEFSSYFEKQVDPCILASKETQTKAYITNNKCIQKDDVFIEEIDEETNRKVLCTFRKYSNLIHKSVSEYRNISVYEGILDQYQQHEKSLNERRESFTLMKPFQLTDNWLFIKQSFKVIPHYMEFEHLSCIAWHPRYIDYVAIAYRGHIHLGKDYYPNASDIQEEYFERIPQVDNLIVIWKVTNELRPTRIITSEFEITCLAFNENYPSLLAGTDNLGQIIFWDLNNFFLPEQFFERKISTQFGDQYVPWKYIPPIITHDAFRVDMYSHEEPVSHIQWFPRNCKVREDETIYEKIQSERLVTGSEDGSIKIWIFQGTDAIPEKLQKQHGHQSRRHSQQIDELLERNMCFVNGVEYVLESVGDEQVPVTAVSCSDYRTVVKTYLLKNSSFNYSSLKDETVDLDIHPGIDRQETISCNIITALCNGKLKVIHAQYNPTNESTSQEPIEGKDTTKNTKSDVKKKAYQFRHEGPVVCLRRCPYAIDIALSVSASSFCIWKEGTTKIRPIFWKRYNIDKEYTNGDWSSHKTASVLLLTSCGIVEFWDLIDQDKSPYMTVRVGISTIEHVFPMTFTLKEDQIAFIEKDLLYFAKVPHTWKKSSIPEGDRLQIMGSHEVLRRRKYHAWKLDYEEKNKEGIARKIKKFKEVLHAEKMKKLSREFNRAKFEECVKFKTPSKKRAPIDAVPKEEIEMKVTRELKVKKAKAIEEQPSTSTSKITDEFEDLMKEVQAALDSYTIDELQQGFDMTEKLFLSISGQDKFGQDEENLFMGVVREIGSEYDSVGVIETEIHGEEEIDNDEINEPSQDEKSVREEIEPYNAFAAEFIDFYSWIRYLDLYYLFPASVLYDQHVNLMPRGNATNFAIECEETFLTALSENTPNIEED